MRILTWLGIISSSTIKRITGGAASAMSKHGHPTYAVGAADYPTSVILTHTIDIFIGVGNNISFLYPIFTVTDLVTVLIEFVDYSHHRLLRLIE